MIHIHSMGRAARYYPEWPALRVGEGLLNFRELHGRIKSLAATLSRRGFGPGDRLALLLPNGPEYIELVYACSWLGVIVVPINTRLSTVEIDHVLTDALPRGLIRHSCLPAPKAHVSWQLVLDQERLEGRNDSCPDPCYDPEAPLALIYTSGTTGRPKGVVMTHSNILENVHHFNTGCPIGRAASICMLRPSSISLIFLQCSLHPRSAHARSRCRVSPRQASAPLSKRRR